MKRLIGKGLKALFNPANQALSQAFWNDRKEPVLLRIWWRFYIVVVPDRMKAWW